MLDTIRSSTILLSLVIFTTFITSSSAFGQTASDVTIATGAGASASAACVATNSCFSPNPLTVAPGTTVTWTNNDN